MVLVCTGRWSSKLKMLCSNEHVSFVLSFMEFTEGLQHEFHKPPSSEANGRAVHRKGFYKNLFY